MRRLTRGGGEADDERQARRSGFSAEEGLTRGACEASDERQAERSGDSREARQADETPKALRRLEGRERVKFVMLSPTAEQMKTSERPPPGGGTRLSGITADIFRKTDLTDSRVPRRAAPARRYEKKQS